MYLIVLSFVLTSLISFLFRLKNCLTTRWRASLSHKENPRGGLDFYRDQFDQQKDEQV